jgi:hypothetical protein
MPSPEFIDSNTLNQETTAFLEFTPPSQVETDTRVDAVTALAAISLDGQVKPFGVNLMTPVDLPSAAKASGTYPSIKTCPVWNPHTKGHVNLVDGQDT